MRYVPNAPYLMGLRRFASRYADGVLPSYLFGSFFSFLSLESFLGFLVSLLPFFSFDMSFLQLG